MVPAHLGSDNPQLLAPFSHLKSPAHNQVRQELYQLHPRGPTWHAGTQMRHWPSPAVHQGLQEGVQKEDGWKPQVIQARPGWYHAVFPPSPCTPESPACSQARPCCVPVYHFVPHGCSWSSSCPTPLCAEDSGLGRSCASCTLNGMQEHSAALRKRCPGTYQTPAWQRLDNLRLLALFPTPVGRNLPELQLSGG